MRRPLTLLTATTATAAVLLTGCGSGSGGASKTTSQTPQAALSTGLNGLSDKDALTITMKFDTTPDKLVAFSKESGKASDVMTPKQAQELANGALVIETKTADGSKLSAAKPGAPSKVGFRIAFTESGQQLVELESLEQVLYAQADVKTLVNTFGKPSQYADLQQRVSALPPFVKDFVNGQWVSLDLNALKTLAGQFGATATPNAQQSQKLTNDLRALLVRDVAVTRIGSDSTGDHLRLTAHTRAFAQDFVQTLGGDIPGAGFATNNFKPQDVPDRPVVLDAWVSDGALAKLSMDMVQFAKPGEAKPGDSLPLVMQFDRSGDAISKPGKATPILLGQLLQVAGALGKK